MQTEPINKAAHRLLQLGITSDEADKALLLLGADGAEQSLVEGRVEHLARLCQACGSLQSAKLAYSLVGRSGFELNSERCQLLAEALGCSECVPAGVRLWKTALEADVADPLYLATAARLGEDGSEQIRVLKLLKEHPERLPAAAELARRLKAPGWECDGSWGGVSDPEKGLVWWDHAVPGDRRSYGMALSAGPISLRGRLGARFVFEARHQILGTTDRCHFEVSLDGKRWEKLVKFEGESAWREVEVDLSRFGERQLYLRFHVLSGGQREGRGIEIANPRLESVQVVRQQKLDFGQLCDGWEHDGPEQGPTTTLVGTQSDTLTESVPFEIGGLLAPTVTMEARVQASSVYAEATVEVLDPDGNVLLKETLHPTPEWQKLSMLLPSTAASELKVRLWSRFKKRRENDGFRVRDARVRAGLEESREVLRFEGGHEDGPREQKAVLELLGIGTVEQLERLVHLRRGLPSLRSALALASLLESDSQIPALLLLFSHLKEEAEPAFKILRELSQEEDLLLQANVLLLSGLEKYPSTRDHLGDGLLPPSEFEDNCRLYLSLRKSWTEEEARRGLSLLLTPVGAEDATERRRRFTELLEKNPEADSFVRAWERHWVSS